MANKKKNYIRPRPLILVILDGWGINEDFEGNAVSRANTPVIDDLIVRYPATTLKPAIGPDGYDKENIGSCIIGHQVIGTGKNYESNFTRINQAIKNQGFYKNEILLKTIKHTAKHNSKLHLLCLLEDSGRDSSINHLFTTLKLAKRAGAASVYLHVFLDGINFSNKSGLKLIKRIQNRLSRENFGSIATIIGRLYALDRDKNWEKTKKAYNAMTIGEGNKASEPVDAVKESYKKNIYDEEFPPTVINKYKPPAGKIEDNDAVIFINLTPDSSRQLSRVFTQRRFNKFKRSRYLKNLFFTTFTECEDRLETRTAFPKQTNISSIGETISERGLKQLKICEISRRGQLTYFFNGLREERLNNEDIIVVPEVIKINYNYTPENNLKLLTNHASKAITRDNYDFLVINYPDIDIAAHSGDIDLTKKTVELLDNHIKSLVKLALDKQGVLILTADHGNAENMLNLKTDEIKIGHTASNLPLIIVGSDYEGRSLGLGDTTGSDLSLISPKGKLADVAPTILEIMDIEKPKEMTGNSLIKI